MEPNWEINSLSYGELNEYLKKNRRSLSSEDIKKIEERLYVLRKKEIEDIR